MQGIPYQSPPVSDQEAGWSYASVIGMLWYLAVNTRGDIVYATSILARSTQKPTQAAREGVKRIARYLQGTKDKGLVYRITDNPPLQAYCDADFAGLWNTEDQTQPISVKSRTGFVIVLGQKPLMWFSKLQTEIALSTTEAEYIGLSQCCREIKPLQRILNELSLALNLPKQHTVNIFEDNQGAIKLSNLPANPPRTKHIALKYHHFREEIRRKRITVTYIDTNDQPADMLTKALAKESFERHRKTLFGW